MRSSRRRPRTPRSRRASPRSRSTPTCRPRRRRSSSSGRGLRGEVSFSALLMDFSRVIPSDAYVNSLAVQADQATVAPRGPRPRPEGGITGSGQAVSIDTLSVFLTRLEQVKGWVNPWMSTVSRNEEVNGYDYSVSVDLTDEVVTERGRGPSMLRGSRAPLIAAVGVPGPGAPHGIPPRAAEDGAGLRGERPARGGAGPAGNARIAACRAGAGQAAAPEARRRSRRWSSRSRRPPTSPACCC